MLISIVLTCYKQEKFIEETILSVIKQKYENRELLIWDDSPDDKCRNIISKYIKKYPDRIKAWHHNPNKWIVNNMQFLLNQRNKKSEYVAFLEWDDCLFPEYLDKKLEVFQNYPNVKLVYNELTAIDENSWVVVEKLLKSQKIKFCKKWKISYEKLIKQFHYKSWSSLMVLSEVFNQYTICCNSLWYRNLISDIYFFNQIAHNDDIYWIEEPLVYYRFHWDSVTWANGAMMFFNLDLIKYVTYLFEQKLIDSSFYKNYVCHCYSGIIAIIIKESFRVSYCKTLKMFIVLCVDGVKRIYKKCINSIMLVYKKHFN